MNVANKKYVYSVSPRTVYAYFNKQTMKCAGNDRNNYRVP